MKIDLTVNGKIVSMISKSAWKVEKVDKWSFQNYVMLEGGGGQGFCYEVLFSKQKTCKKLAKNHTNSVKMSSKGMALRILNFSPPPIFVQDICTVFFSFVSFSSPKMRNSFMENAQNNFQSNFRNRFFEKILEFRLISISV